MFKFSFFTFATLIGSMLVLPYLASTKGWGIGTEQNQKIIKQTEEYCPDYAKNQNGNCQKNHRSYYHGRSAIGGGNRVGK